MLPRQNFRIAADDSITSSRVGEQSVRWQLILVVLMRLLAGLWMLRALLAWTVILGVSPQQSFEQLALPGQSVICVYAILNCIVAVGLWLAASWGAALWILMMLVDGAVLFLLPGSHVTSQPIVLFTGVCVALYAGLAWLAHRESMRAVH